MRPGCLWSIASSASGLAKRVGVLLRGRTEDELTREVLRRQDLRRPISRDEPGRATERDPGSQPPLVGVEFSQDVVVGLAVSLDDVTLGADLDLQHDVLD